MLLGNLLTIAHVGDSKGVLGSVLPGTKTFVGRCLTPEHRPDEPAEVARIAKVCCCDCHGDVIVIKCAWLCVWLQAGGKVVYMHSGKPYLRGADFDTLRAAVSGVVVTRLCVLRCNVSLGCDSTACRASVPCN